MAQIFLHQLLKISLALAEGVEKENILHVWTNNIEGCLGSFMEDERLGSMKHTGET